MINILNKIFLKVYKAINILFSFNSRVYYSFLRYGISPSFEHKKILNKIKLINTFVDIGANKGQFSLIIHYLFPRSKIIAFEPLPSEFKILKKIFKKKDNIRLFNYAVGKENKYLDIFQTNKKDSSSFLKPDKLQLKYFPETYVKKILKVKMVRLNFLLKILKKPVFLKIDVQGYELEVLKGTNLKNFDYIYLEGSYAKLYTKQPLIGKIFKYLTEKGFKLNGRFNLTNDNFGKPLQADFLFKNKKNKI